MSNTQHATVSREFDPAVILAERTSQAIERAFPDAAGHDPLVAPSRNPDFGDFQINAAMPLAKSLGKKPRDIAAAIVENLDLSGLAEPLTADAVAGPGFINIRLKPDALAELLATLDAPALGLADTHDAEGRPAAEAPVVVDLCGVNLAKQMHVGHLRSIIIGDAIARILERLGHKVIRQNHVGDWGLPIAMVTREVAAAAQRGEINLDDLDLATLEKLYRRAQLDCAADHRGLAAARKWWAHPKAVAELEAQVEGAEKNLAEAKRTLVELQNHDENTLVIWRRLVDVTMAACMDICARLHADIDADDSAGESSYAEELAGLAADLEKRHIAEVSENALVIRNDGIEQPTLVRKSDGGYLYATTDLAAIRRRVQKLGATRVIYCVDARQSLHFKQVFASAVKAGYATPPGADAPALLEHAAFGMVLGEDQKPFKTRSGENVKLADLVDEAIRLAAEQVAQRNPDLPEDDRAKVAEAVAIAALKYGDLSSERSRDYVFSFQRLIAFEGNTGPYLLYALTRVRSIFRKAAEKFGDSEIDLARSSPLALNEPAERTLALTLLRYPAVVRSAAATLEPHRLCQYLYDLAGAYSSFFEHCHVLNAPDDGTRRSRLRLCAIVERVLDDGLAMLGIPSLDRM